MGEDLLKKNVASIGSNIHHVGASLGSSLGSSVKKITRHKDFDADEELIDHLEHDIKQSRKALSFLVAQSDRMAKNYWPHLFKTSIKITKFFLHLLGDDSLRFKDIETYFDEFDNLQTTTELFRVHPKERQFVIPSMQFELHNYLASMEQLQNRVLWLSEMHARLLKLRVNQMLVSLKHILKFIKSRNHQKDSYNSLCHKTEKIMKKRTPLDEKEQHELSALEIKSKEAHTIFQNTNDKLKVVLPESLLLLEEFVDLVTKWTLCHQKEVYEEVDKTLRYYSVFHGFVSLKLEDAEVPEKLIQTYETIMDQWETTITPVRLQIESFLLVIFDKNPNRLDEEIDDKDKSLKASKVWSAMSLKLRDKLHHVKTKDSANGVFTDYIMADSIQSYIKYQNPNVNLSETYHPSKMIDISKVHISVPEKRTPPPLPPRDHHPMSLPVIGSPIMLTTPPSSFGHKSTDSFDSIHSESELSPASESEDSSLVDVPTVMVSDSTPDRSERSVAKLYNSSKNEISEVPITTTKWRNFDQYMPGKDVFNETNTISYKLLELNKFFLRALAQVEKTDGKTVLIAKKGFEGAEPGDLFFKEGDEVEVLFDLQLVSTSYSNDGRNWFVGSTGTANRRVGFAPNTYF